ELNNSHFLLLHRWLNNKHVRTVWDGPQSSDAIIKKYQNQIYSSHIFSFIVFWNDTPFGFIQSYHACKVESGWWEDEPIGTWGVDFFIGEVSFLKKGHGSKILTQFTDDLLSNPNIKKIISDPSPSNKGAIRSLQLAGFRNQKVIKTPDGKALLMTKLK
ncbi:acetyltransferase, partial [Bacteriovoracaceae bacterium]|nr:acetyltransferase [Bacteriovoracaceae bacterium]